MVGLKTADLSGCLFTVRGLTLTHLGSDGSSDKNAVELIMIGMCRGGCKDQ